MILLSNIFINTYNENINNISSSHLSCPKCASIGRFHKHGTYNRYSVDIINDSTYTTSLNILRVKCVSCGSTHAILPSQVIPYTTYSASFILSVFYNVFVYKKTIPYVSSKFNISHQLIYSFRRRLLIFMSLIINVLHILGIHDFDNSTCSIINTIFNHFSNINNLLLAFFEHNQWYIFMTKFHNILSPPIFIKMTQCV